MPAIWQQLVEAVGRQVGQACEDSTASGPNASFQFLQPGTYTVTLAVTDAAGSLVTNSDTITVLNLGPVVVAPTDQSVPQASTLSFQTTFTDPGPLDTHTFTPTQWARWSPNVTWIDVGGC